MPTRLILSLDESLPADIVQSCVDLCFSFATMLDEPVLVSALDVEGLRDLHAWTQSRAAEGSLLTVEPRNISAAPMTAAPFVYKDDGRPDWSAMWGSFCELALYGGPPHRGPDAPLEAPVVEEDDRMVLNDTIMEIRRGIFETTGLYSEPAPPAWLAVSCHSKRMAAWMCAAIILENVDARCEEEVLYVPAHGDFDLKTEVKSVITVVAKVNHYWQAHIAELQMREGTAEV